MTMKRQTKILTILIYGILILNSCSVYKTKIYTGKSENTSYQNTYIKTNNFEGVIFSKDYFTFIGGERFTPTMSDIDLIEKILRKEIKEINVNRPNQIGNCPIIHKKLKKYKRQYFGYFDTNGDRIIFINCFWERGGFYEFIDRVFYNEPPDNKWKTEEVFVLDGCSYYWSIKVNLTTKTLFDFCVNGIA